MSKMSNTHEKILVMRYRFIGDTLLTVPFLRALRQAKPNATIDMLVAPNSGEILEHCPYVDNLIYFDTTRKHRYENLDKPPTSFWTYVELLKEKQFDTAFVLKRSISSAALAFLAGIPNRIGFNTEWRWPLLTKAVPYKKDHHEVDCFLDVLNAVGITSAGRYLESWWTPAEEEAINQRLPMSLSGPNVVLHMTSSNDSKLWPEDFFLKLTEWLLTEEKASVHLLGSEADATVYHNLMHHLPNSCQPYLSNIHNWCGETSLLESLALLKRMDCVIGVDSGTLHMAAAVDTPAIALFSPISPTHSTKWAPVGERHQLLIYDFTRDTDNTIQHALKDVQTCFLKTGKIIVP